MVDDFISSFFVSLYAALFCSEVVLTCNTRLNVSRRNTRGRQPFGLNLLFNLYTCIQRFFSRLELHTVHKRFQRIKHLPSVALNHRRHSAQ